MRSYLAMALFLAALAWKHEARADQAPVGATWVGPDGRTYYVPPGAPLAEREEPEPERRGRKQQKPKGPRNSLGMAVAGGIFLGLGGMAFVGGLAGYFATIDCNSGWIFPSCTDHKEILLVSLGGIVGATAIGTPLLVVGLRRRPLNEIQELPAEEATLSFTLGPVSGLSLSF